MEEKVFEPEEVVTVLIDQPINGGLLDYIVSEDPVSLGQFVEIPIGKRFFVGVIWNKRPSKIQREKLRYIRRILDIPFMTNELKNFLIEISRYTVNPLNKVFKLAVRNNYFRIKPKKFFAFQKGRISKFRMTSGRSAIMSVFDKFPEKALSKADLKKEIKLKYELEKNVNLVKFENGRIEISFNDNLDKDFVKNLSIKLLEWTSQRWIISFSKNRGEMSIRDKEKNTQKKLIEDEKNSDLYKKVLDKFPDAELIDIKHIRKDDEK